MKLDHEEEPQFSEPYLSKQKKLMVRTGRAAGEAAVREEEAWRQLTVGKL